jgi:hypothetical protein
VAATDNTDFPFKINGVQLSSDKPVVSVREILQLGELLAKPCGEAIFGLDKRRQDAGGQLRSTRG